jgi:hypothetical protein
VQGWRLCLALNHRVKSNRTRWRACGLGVAVVERERLVHSPISSTLSLPDSAIVSLYCELVSPDCQIEL